MPEKVILQDGSEREVPTAEELTALQARAGQAETFEQEKLRLMKEKEDLEQGADPDWQNVRAKLKEAKALKEQLKAQGKHLKEDGTFEDVPQTVLTGEDVDRRAAVQATKIALDTKVTDLLAKYDSDTKGVIRSFYDQLTRDKQVTPDNVGEFVAAATRAAGVDVQVGAPRERQHPSYGSGRDPQPQSVSTEQKKKAIANAEALGYKFKSDKNKLIS